jgi:glycyl-tRNA synthetase alpha subunit
MAMLRSFGGQNSHPIPNENWYGLAHLAVFFCAIDAISDALFSQGRLVESQIASGHVFWVKRLFVPHCLTLNPRVQE